MVAYISIYTYIYMYIYMYMYIFSIYRFTTRITTRKGKYNIQHRWFPLLNMTNHGPLAKATVPELDPEKIYRVGSEEKVGLTCGFLWFYCRCSPEKKHTIHWYFQSHLPVGSNNTHLQIQEVSPVGSISLIPSWMIRLLQVLDTNHQLNEIRPWFRPNTARSLSHIWWHYWTQTCLRFNLIIRGVPGMGYPNSWLVYSGKSD